MEKPEDTRRLRARAARRLQRAMDRAMDRGDYDSADAIARMMEAADPLGCRGTALHTIGEDIAEEDAR